MRRIRIWTATRFRIGSSRRMAPTPIESDSDGDSFNDDVDAFPLDASRHILPSSNPYDTTGPVITLKEPVSARPVP